MRKLLILAVEDLKRKIEIPLTIQEVIPERETEFYGKVMELAVQAFDDQCTGANPRYPLIEDLKELYLLAYRGSSIEKAAFVPSNGNGKTPTTDTESEPQLVLANN